MNGAESLLQTLVGSGVDTCFMNPGTSEMHFVAALDAVPVMRPVLGLFEGVVTGMADGYARIAERPAATLLHLGPGLANGLANLHNARRAASPVINIVGDHATHHLRYDAPLASDISGFARPVSGWLHAATSSRTIASDTARAVAAALEPPGQVATLILPADIAWGEAGTPAVPAPILARGLVDEATIARIAGGLQTKGRSALLMRGPALTERGLRAAGRVAAATGAVLLADTFAPRLTRGVGVVAVRTVPYFAEQVVAMMQEFDQLVLVGTKPPVAFFAYPDKASWCTPDHVAIDHLALEHEDGVVALEALADMLGAPGDPAGVVTAAAELVQSQTFDQFGIGQVIGRHLPEGAIISEEAATNSLGVAIGTAGAARHDYLKLTGGSIGQALPVATGAAIARPEAKILCLQGDGGAMYTVQALWTQAREALDVTTVIFANRSYGILNIELTRMGLDQAGPKAASMLNLERPTIDWVGLATSLGVEASRATDIAGFEAQFVDAMRRRGPRLIEAVL